MWVKQLFVVAGVTAVVVVGLAPLTPAAACSVPSCSWAELLESEIPANARGVVWSPFREDASSGETPEVDAADVVLELQRDGEFAEIQSTVSALSGSNRFLIRSDAGFDPNAEYRIRAVNYCRDNGGLGEEGEFRATFSTTEAAALPDALGEISVERQDGTISATEARDACRNAEFKADQAAIELRLNEDMRPWSSGLEFRAQVRRPDTETWMTERGLEKCDRICSEPQYNRSDVFDIPELGALLFTQCTTPDVSTKADGLAPGEWEVRMQATRPATGRTWATDAMRIDLSCSDAIPAEADAGSDAGGAGLEWRDTEAGGCACGSRSNGLPAFPGSLIFVVLLCLGGRWFGGSVREAVC